MTELLTVQEAAAMLRVSDRTIRSWRKSGILPAVKIGGVVRYRREAIEQLIDAGSEGHGHAVP